jgi:hypothetical protein
MECCSICYDPLNGGKESSFLNDEVNDAVVVVGGNNIIALDERWDGCLANPKLHFCNECIFQYLQVRPSLSSLLIDSRRPQSLNQN